MLTGALMRVLAGVVTGVLARRMQLGETAATARPAATACGARVCADHAHGHTGTRPRKLPSACLLSVELIMVRVATCLRVIKSAAGRV